MANSKTVFDKLYGGRPGNVLNKYGLKHDNTSKNSLNLKSQCAHCYGKLKPREKSSTPDKYGFKFCKTCQKEMYE
jgi:hypothetical protein